MRGSRSSSRSRRPDAGRHVVDGDADAGIGAPPQRAGVEEILLPAVPSEADIAGLGGRLAPSTSSLSGRSPPTSSRPRRRLQRRSWRPACRPSPSPCARHGTCWRIRLPGPMSAATASCRRRWRRWRLGSSAKSLSAGRLPVALSGRIRAVTGSSHGTERRDPETAGGRPAPARFGARGIRADLRRGQGAPAGVCRHRCPRHLRQRRDLRAVPAGDPDRLDCRPGGAVDGHALRRAPEHGRRARRRHVAVGPLAGHRRGGRRGAASGRPDGRADQRHGLPIGRHRRPRGGPVRRTGAATAATKTYTTELVAAAPAVDGTRPASSQRKRPPGRPAWR